MIQSILPSDEKLNIICLSNQLWDFPNWTNKKHVMTRMAKNGHKVLFVDPPINTGRVFLTQIKRGLWSIWRLITQIKKDPTGALIYTPLNAIPSREFTSKQHIKRINSLASRFFDKKYKTVLWVYHVQIPELKTFIDNLNYDLLVYDCVDNYEGFPANSTFYSATVPKNMVMEQEKMLSKKADLVFATAPGLVDKLKKYNPNVIFTPNVGDYEKFKDVEKYRDNLPEDIANIKRPRVGFTGSLDEYKFDAQLMKKVALDHPEISFVLIGQVALKDKNAGLSELGLEGIPNIHHLGFKPFETLDKYYAGFDAYIIPYQLNDYTVGGCFPIKFHDSLAAGLPVIVTNLPAYLPFSDVCYIAHNPDDFSKLVKKALDEDSEEKIKQRKDVAAQNNWDGKVAYLTELIMSKFSEVEIKK